MGLRVYVGTVIKKVGEGRTKNVTANNENGSKATSSKKRFQREETSVRKATTDTIQGKTGATVGEAIQILSDEE